MRPFYFNYLSSPYTVDISRLLNDVRRRFLEGELWMGGLRFKLAIIDTAGSYSFPAMNRVSIATADAVLLVYSIDDPASFRQVVELRQQVGEQRRDVPVVVVGNKSDLKCQCPTVGGPESATSWAYVDLDRGHVEVSAKEDVNIGEIFVELVSQGNISAKLEQQIRSGLSTTTSRDCSNVNKCCTIS